MQDTAIFFQKLDERAVTPSYAHQTDAAADLSVTEGFDIQPMERVLAKTGLAVAIPNGFEGQIRPRSGQAWKRGLTVVNSPGTIDASYRGEVRIALINLGTETITIEAGERVAQMKIAPVVHGNYIESEDLDETVRGTGGFGHTGNI